MLYKKNKIFALLAAVVLVCGSCLPISDYPLSEKSYHEEKLLGTWIVKDEEGKVEETVEISDSGPRYSWKSTKDDKVMSFILTKLESYYFMSLCADEEGWVILRVQIQDNKFAVLGLNEEGLKLYEKMTETQNDKVKMKVSREELQKWCISNAKLFSEELSAYEKQQKTK